MKPVTFHPPNWGGIAWLEANSIKATTEFYRSTSDADGLINIWYRGVLGNHSHLHRPVFELIPTDPNCDNIAYTRDCPEHPPTPPSPEALAALAGSLIFPHFTTGAISRAFIQGVTS